MNSKIQFFPEGISFILKKKNAIRLWLLKAISEEKRTPWYINFIFCNDGYLIDLNKIYLHRDTLTDIITFPFSDQAEIISGDIYISVERVEENAKKYGEPMEMELRRVMIHGVLHLLGYKDKKVADKRLMREKENYYLNLFKNSEIPKQRNEEIK